MDTILDQKTGARSGPARLDIVIPVYNEEAALNHLFERLEQTFSPQAMDENGLERVRLIFVDDGGTDSSAMLIARRIQQGADAMLLCLSRNFGHQSAVCAGLAHSDADITAVIDADLQDPPELIQDMVKLWRNGNDVVYGMRRRRRENPLKVFAYWAFYRLLRFLSGSDVPLDSGDFCLLDAEVVRAMNALPEKLRFPRGLRYWVGFRQTGIQYDRPRRMHGTSKYPFKKLYSLATDGIASLSIKPLKISQMLSISTAAAAILLIAILLIINVKNMPSGIDAGIMLILLCILITSAAQLLSIYILGAYVGRTYLEVKNRPTYIIRETISKEELNPQGGQSPQS